MAETDKNTGERIAKVLARAGVASRREVERLITAGRVAIGGKTVTSPATFVTGVDGITVDGEPVAAPEAVRLWRYHKPVGVMTTAHDPQGRTTVFDTLPDNLPRLITVGRLDLTTEGLLLLTNDGEVARFMELPATGWARRYRVRVHGSPTEKQLETLKAGIEIDGIRYGPVHAAIDRRTGANVWLTVSLTEGKNREIRRIMEHLGLTVSRLIRVGYGPFQLGNLNPGALDEVSGSAIANAFPDHLLRKQGRP